MSTPTHPADGLYYLSLKRLNAQHACPGHVATWLEDHGPGQTPVTLQTLIEHAQHAVMNNAPGCPFMWLLLSMESSELITYKETVHCLRRMKQYAPKSNRRARVLMDTLLTRAKREGRVRQEPAQVPGGGEDVSVYGGDGCEGCDACWDVGAVVEEDQPTPQARPDGRAIPTAQQWLDDRQAEATDDWRDGWNACRGYYSYTHSAPAPDVAPQCGHNWSDYGQMNVVRCDKCEARAVAGYEDQPFTAAQQGATNGQD